MTISQDGRVFREKLKIGSESEKSSRPPGPRLGLAIVVASAAGFCLLALWLWAGKSWLDPAGRQMEKNTVVVARGPIDVRISATGIIKPYNQVKVSPKFTGLLKHLLVQQGDAVRKGQLIAVMDDSNLVGQVQAARAAFEVARSNYQKALKGNRPQEVANAAAMVSKAESQVRHAERSVSKSRAHLKAAAAQVERDETNARRLTDLARQGAVSDQDKLNATTQAEVSRAQLQQAQQELQQAESMLLQAKADLEAARQQHSLMKAGFREEDVQAAHDSMIQAQGNLHFLESQLNDTRIRAPFDGVVTQKYTDEGAIVTPTTSAATESATSSSIISLAGKLELVASVSETDIENIRVGQPVEIVANAYPEKTFHGTVNLIAPEAIVTQNVTTFEVHATIVDDDQHLLMSGMNVNAQFLSGRKDDVLLVPTACIISKQGKTGVLVPDGSGEPGFKPIKIGATSGTQTEVISGLKEGERLFLGLTKTQLEQEGYDSGTSSDKNAKKRPGMPRGLGRGH